MWVVVELLEVRQAHGYIFNVDVTAFLTNITSFFSLRGLTNTTAFASLAQLLGIVA